MGLGWMVFLLYTESSEVTPGYTAGGWPGLEVLGWLHSHNLVLWWWWLQGWAQMGLLTGVSPLQASSLKVIWLLTQWLRTPRQRLKTRSRSYPSLRPGFRSWYSVTSTILHRPKATEHLPDSKEGDADASPRGKSVQECVAIFNWPHNHTQKDIHFLG